MWFKVEMVADDYDMAIVSLNNSEYMAVKNFLNQIKEQRCVYGWVGGHWTISQPCETKEEAERITIKE